MGVAEHRVAGRSPAPGNGASPRAAAAWARGGRHKAGSVELISHAALSLLFLAAAGRSRSLSLKK